MKPWGAFGLLVGSARFVRSVGRTQSFELEKVGEEVTDAAWWGKECREGDGLIVEVFEVE